MSCEQEPTENPEFNKSVSTDADNPTYSLQMLSHNLTVPLIGIEASHIAWQIVNDATNEVIVNYHGLAADSDGNPVPVGNPLQHTIQGYVDRELRVDDTVTLLTTSDLDNFLPIRENFVQEIDRINELNVPYGIVGNNSNAVASLLGEAAGFSEETLANALDQLDTPLVGAPGFGEDISIYAGSGYPGSQALPDDDHCPEDEESGDGGGSGGGGSGFGSGDDFDSDFDLTIGFGDSSSDYTPSTSIEDPIGFDENGNGIYEDSETVFEGTINSNEVQVFPDGTYVSEDGATGNVKDADDPIWDPSGDSDAGPSNDSGSGSGSGDGGSGGGSSGGGGGGGGDSTGAANEQGASDPLVLDLLGNGIELVNLRESTAFFDLQASGFSILTSWVGADDALLAIDGNQDGVINDITELFGDATTEGFSKLATLDSNADGIISALDSAFSDLLLWIDVNSDGVSESFELLTLEQVGVASLNLSYVNTGNEFSTDGRIARVGEFTWEDGRTGELADVEFAIDGTFTNYTANYAFFSEVLAVQDIKGYGTLPNLHIAMSLDTSFRNWAINLLEDPDVSSLVDNFKQLMIRWGGLQDLTAEDLGLHEDLLLGDNGNIVSFSNAGERFTVSELGIIQAYTGEENLNLEDGRWRDADGTLDVVTVGGLYRQAYNEITRNLLAKFAVANGFLSELLPDVSYDVDSDLLITSIDITEYDFTGLINQLQSNHWNEDAVNEIALAMITLVEINPDLLPQLVEAFSTSNARWTLQWGTFNNELFQLLGISGSDAHTLYGLEIDDVLLGYAGDDVIWGLEGDDTLWGGEGDDDLVGGSGDDTLHGENGDDRLVGSDGDDTLIGGNGDDDLQGRDGDDTLDGGNGRDILQGGTGNDTIIGDNGDDELIGNAGDDLLDGGNGNDDLAGGDGNDTLIGYHGDDILYGNDGNDHIDGGNGDDDLDGGLGDDVLIGDNGQDMLSGGAGNDTLDGGNDNDTLSGGDGRDYLDGYNGNDHLSGGNGRDTLIGYNGDDVLIGGRDDDTLDGGNGNDTLNGGAGNDTLIGYNGNDVFDGGAGNDIMTGGWGSDVFIYGVGDGRDTITDFGAGNDVIDLSQTSRTGIESLLIEAAGDNAQDTFIRVGAPGSGDIIYLEDVDFTTIDANDFIFA